MTELSIENSRIVLFSKLMTNQVTASSCWILSQVHIYEKTLEELQASHFI